MQVELRVGGVADPSRELVSLRDWLVRDDLLRGRVTMAQQLTAADQMGGVTDALQAALGAGGAVGAFAAALMMWIRYRRPDVTIEVKNATTGVGFSVSGKGWSQDLIAKALDGVLLVTTQDVTSGGPKDAS